MPFRISEKVLKYFKGFCSSPATLQRWVIKFASLIDMKVRKAKKPVGKSWKMDETLYQG